MILPEQFSFFAFYIEGCSVVYPECRVTDRKGGDKRYESVCNTAFMNMVTAERGGIMRINKELALDCPMTTQILNSSSRKKKELIIRLAERQLKELGYTQHQFRNSEDIRFVIEMMDRGFISGCPVTERRRSMNTGRGIRRVLAVEDTKSRESDSGNQHAGTEVSVKGKDTESNPAGNKMEVKDFKNDYLDAVRSILGDDEFGSITEGEV